MWNRDKIIKQYEINSHKFSEVLASKVPISHFAFQALHQLSILSSPWSMVYHSQDGLRYALQFCKDVGSADRTPNHHSSALASLRQGCRYCVFANLSKKSKIEVSSRWILLKVRSDQVKVKSSQVRSGSGDSGQVQSGLGQVRSGQVRVKSGQVRSNWVQLGFSQVQSGPVGVQSG